MGNVDTSRIARGGVTGVTIVLLDPDGERTIIVLPNANDDLAYEDIDLEYAADCAYLHLTSFAGDTPTLAQITLAQTIPQATGVSFDPGEIHTQKGLVKMMPIFRRSNVVFITDREIRLLTGEDYVDGAHEVLNYGPEIVVAKLGKAGSYILAGDQEFSVRSGAVTAVDKTGAGDVYAAGFLAGLIRGLPPLRCAEAADKAASHSITGWGREAYPDASLFERAG
jgi:ribokinase